MAPTSRQEGLRALAVAAVEGAGLVLEDVIVVPAGRRSVVRVIVDLPDGAVGGVPLETVAAASQAVSSALDASDVMGASPYVLEVSSPGVERPLTLRRHWSRARGRRVSAALAAGGVVAGRLTTVDDAGITVDGVGYPWSRLGVGRVEIEFTPAGGADAGSDDSDDREDS